MTSDEYARYGTLLRLVERAEGELKALRLFRTNMEANTKSTRELPITCASMPGSSNVITVTFLWSAEDKEYLTVLDVMEATLTRRIEAARAEMEKL